MDVDRHAHEVVVKQDPDAITTLDNQRRTRIEPIVRDGVVHGPAVDVRHALLDTQRRVEEAVGTGHVLKGALRVLRPQQDQQEEERHQLPGLPAPKGQAEAAHALRPLLLCDDGWWEAEEDQSQQHNRRAVVAM